jgi:hypothetical protein
MQCLNLRIRLWRLLSKCDAKGDVGSSIEIGIGNAGKKYPIAVIPFLRLNSYQLDLTTPGSKP